LTAYTYQHNTRDSFGFALKSTMCVVEGEQRNIFKNPATDDGTKKSNTGVVAVVNTDTGYACVDNLKIGHAIPDAMQDVFIDGNAMGIDNLAIIRSRLKNQ
jgi:nicotinamide phosphoribosyltransferase